MTNSEITDSGKLYHVKNILHNIEVRITNLEQEIQRKKAGLGIAERDLIYNKQQYEVMFDVKCDLEETLEKERDEF